MVRPRFRSDIQLQRHNKPVQQQFRGICNMRAVAGLTKIKRANLAALTVRLRVDPKCKDLTDLPFSPALVVFISSIDAGSDVPNFPRATTIMRYKAFSSKLVRSMLVSLVVNS